ncbi:MAG: sigma 54-interacting transcriptional regulator [Chitinispirillaceae bacterium]|nr:sigma 54-interacting transcriptional regulator [Chitinispirillaceae bacterium]
MSWTKEELIQLFDTIQEGVFAVDNECRVTFFNRAAESITGTGKSHALGRPCWEVLRADCCGEECLLRKTLKTGELFSERPVTMITADGSSKLVSIATTVLQNPDGTVKGAVETFRDLTSDEARSLARLSDYRYQDFITINRRMQKILETLPMIADSASTVLLQGESGTGKELIARAIHTLGPRSDKPFIAVNCGALPDTLLASELFGYKAGAFTDAKKDKPGRFALAEGGILFLDEIGDTSTAMQVKLLRVLQEKEYEPLGSVQSRKTDVRIIAATNRDLEKMVDDGVFRKDLYYRLNIIGIAVPPLRERRDDIPLLADYFINKHNKQQQKHIRGIDNRAMARLIAHDFPGNVRELENMIERAFVLCRRGYFGVDHLFFEMGRQAPVDTGTTEESTASMRSFESAFLLNALRRNHWKRGTTARELGIDRSTLYRKMRLLGLRPPSDGEQE